MEGSISLPMTIRARLPSPSGEIRPTTAFDDFHGLQAIFDKGELALWEYGNQQVLWVPLEAVTQFNAIFAKNV